MQGFPPASSPIPPRAPLLDPNHPGSRRPHPLGPMPRCRPLPTLPKRPTDHRAIPLVLAIVGAVVVPITFMDPLDIAVHIVVGDVTTWKTVSPFPGVSMAGAQGRRAGIRAPLRPPEEILPCRINKRPYLPGCADARVVRWMGGVIPFPLPACLVSALARRLHPSTPREADRRHPW